MASSKQDQAAKPDKIVRDLGKATEKTQSGAPPERVDNFFLHKKGPWLP